MGDFARPHWPEPQFKNKSFFLPDVTFAVEGKLVFAHQHILIQRCEYFEIMFNAGMIESASPHTTIVIDDVSHDAFLKLLGYLYTDKIEIEDTDIMELAHLADMYHLPKLGHRCSSMVVKFLKVKNVISFLQDADSWNLAVIRSICLDYARANLAKITKADVETLSIESIIDFLQGTEEDSIKLYSIAGICNLPKLQDHAYKLLRKSFAMEKAACESRTLDHKALLSICKDFMESRSARVPELNWTTSKRMLSDIAEVSHRLLLDTVEGKELS
mmetsp:Transcript_3739/g.10290  ORF Transcript_3739/g.10290 Transcript_3739/m.10290 type:complete len:273 (-) Transcript_3739:1967-2785(-)